MVFVLVLQFGCPDGAADGGDHLPLDSDFESYCTLVTNAFFGCYGAIAFVALAQAVLACVLLRAAKSGRAASRSRH